MEKWIMYRGCMIPDDCYEVINTVVNSDGTIIVLEGEKYHLSINFIYTEVVMLCDEGRRIKTYLSREELQEYRIDFKGNPIYEVINSEFEGWIKEQSLDLFHSYKHYVIITQNDVIDILTRDKPNVNIIKIC